MAFQVDPDAGRVEVAFAHDAPPALVDPFEAVDFALDARQKYMKELEAANKQAEYDEVEYQRRAVCGYFTAERFPDCPGLDPQKWTRIARAELLSFLFAEYLGSKKGEPESPTPG